MTAFGRLVLVMLLACGLGAVANAQDDTSTAGPALPITPDVMDSAEAQRVAELAADRLARNALIFVRGLEDPMAEDYRAVALTLEVAASVRTNDLELLRLIQEAWYAAGNDAKVVEVTKKIIQLDPDDTVAQLRLISHRMRQFQSVEDRQAAYNRLLVEGADALDASVRSRLALDDALLARELGDEDRFVSRLTMATQLDPTNKTAAMLAATYTMERLDEPLARVEMLANVVLADPFDPATHSGLANELISNGAFESARRFFQHAAALMRMRGQQPPNELFLRVLLSTWAVEGSRNVLDTLAESERLERYTVIKQREAAELAGQDPDQVPPFTPVPINESLKLAAGHAIGDHVVAQQALDRLTLMTSAAIAELERLRAAPPDERQGMSAEEFADLAREWRISLLWNRLWTGLQLDAAEASLEFVRAEVDAGLIRPEALQRFRGILAAQRGDIETAKTLLSPLAASDARARVGLGIAFERDGDLRGAMREYAAVALNDPGSMLGIWARTRIETLLGQTLERSGTALALENYCRNFPQEIDRMIREPRSMMHLDVSHLGPELKPFERLQVRVSIRNVSPIPLAIGPGAPISSELLLSPRLTLGSNQVIEQITPEIVALNKRLRLLPGQSVEATIWAGQGQTGAVNDQALLSSALLRWRAVEGFVVGADGSFVPSPLSLAADSRIIRRPPVELPPGGAIRLPQWVQTYSGIELAKVLTVAPAAMQFVQSQGGDELAKTVIDGYTSALLGRLPSLDAYQRSIVTQLLPSTATTEEFLPIEEELRADDNRFVRLTYLFVRTTSPDDPIFEMCVESGDPLVETVASQLRERIRRMVEQRTTAAPQK